jgi:hypothetical protein
MRSVVVIAIAVFALLGVLSPPVFAQAPAPKVTINGLIDTITFASKNYSQEVRDCSKTHDVQWVSRNRGVFTLWGEVGKVKGALALEFDIGWGNTVSPAGPTPTTNENGVTTTATGGTSKIAFLNGEFGTNNDVNGIPEVKWLFVEFPLPWVPAPTIARIGGQSNRWTYKPSILIYTDSPGVTLETTWSPALKSRLAYFQFNESSVGFNKGPTGAATDFRRGDDCDIEASVEISPFKGLDIQPMYVYWEQGPIGTQSGSGSLGWEPGRGGVPQANTPNTLTGPCEPVSVVNGCKEYRHYLGVDARWKAGIFFFNPTFIYTWGKRDIVNPVDLLRYRQNDHGYYLDLEGGVTLGPLTVPVIAIYSPGNKASTNIGNRAGKPNDVNYYQTLYVDGSWGTGRISEVLSNNSIDYVKGFALSTALSKSVAVGWDRYGAVDVGVRPKYAMTPALTVGALVATHWTPEKVDTNAGFSVQTGLVPAPNGSQRGRIHLGEDFALYLTYVFAPAVTFDIGSGILFTGNALTRCNISETTASALAVGTTGCTTGRKDAKDAYWGAARVRYQF